MPKVGQGVTEVGQGHWQGKEVGVVPLQEVLEVEVGQQPAPGAGQVLMPVLGVGLLPQLGVPKVGQAEVGRGHQLEVGQDLGRGRVQLLQGEVDRDQDLQLQEVGHGRDPEEAGQGQGQLRPEEVGHDLARQHREVGRGPAHQVAAVLHHTLHMVAVEVGQLPRLAAEAGHGQPPLRGRGVGLGHRGGAGKVRRAMTKRRAVGMRKSKCTKEQLRCIFADNYGMILLIST